MLPLCNWIRFVSVVGISLNRNSFHCLLAFRPSSPRVQNTRNLKQGVIIILLLHTLTLLAQAECFHTVLLSISVSSRLWDALGSQRELQGSSSSVIALNSLMLSDNPWFAESQSGPGAFLEMQSYQETVLFTSVAPSTLSTWHLAT